MRAKSAVKLLNQFEDACYWLRLMKEHRQRVQHLNFGATADRGADYAIRRHEASARRLFKALVGRFPTREELDDILY